MDTLISILPSQRRFQLLFGGVSILAILLAAYVASYSTLGALATVFIIVIAVPLGIWFLHEPKFGMTLVILSVIPGNLVRLSLSTDVHGGSAILLSDIAIPLVVLAWVLRKLVLDKKVTSTTVDVPFIVFTVVAFISFVQGIFVLDRIGGLDLKNVVIAFLYWARWVEYGLLFFVTADLVRTPRDANYYFRVLLAGAIVLAVGGYFQLIFYPDFTDYAIKYGWDPHQGRLLSSFFDPNFIGGFFALLLSVLMGLFFYTGELRQRVLYLIPAAILGIALILTYSRSGYLALLVAGLVIGILRSRFSLVVGMIIIVITLAAVPRTLTRVTEGLSVDETGVKRIESWTKAVSLIPMYPLFGTGYNMLATVQDQLGTVDEFDVNNRSGVENSFLTVFVTTGIIGLVAFTYLYFVMLRSLYRNWKNEALPDRWRGLNLGVFAGILGLVVHSIFIHSLMYPFILIYLWVLLAIALRSATFVQIQGAGHRLQNTKNTLQAKKLTS